MTATLMGRTKTDWLKHIEELFDAAHETEDIPQAALLHAWTGEVTQSDKDWADREIRQRGADARREYTRNMYGSGPC